jgi:hypothetical protein
VDVEKAFHVALKLVVSWLVGGLSSRAAEEGAERVEERRGAVDAVAGLFAQGLVDASLTTLARASRALSMKPLFLTPAPVSRRLSVPVKFWSTS